MTAWPAEPPWNPRSAASHRVLDFFILRSASVCCIFWVLLTPYGLWWAGGAGLGVLVGESSHFFTKPGIIFPFPFPFLSFCVSLDFLSVHQAVDVLARQFLLLAHLSRPDAHEKILIVINLKWRCVRSCFLSKFLLCSELFLSSLINNNWSQRFSECMPR